MIIPEEFEFTRELVHACIGNDKLYDKVEKVFNDYDNRLCSASWARTRIKFLLIDEKLRRNPEKICLI